MSSVAERLFVKPVEYKRFSGEERELEREKMYEVYIKSSKEIWIVAGELDGDFYNETFANIISQKLKESPNYKVNMLFSKDENLDYEGKIKKTYEENEQLCKLLKYEAFGDRFSMYLSEKRPENHFGIVDNCILIEKIHNQGEPRDVLLVDNYKTLVEKYKKYFMKLTVESHIKRLTFSDFQKFAA